ncbi:hypothetical protein K402DRAFT_388755 [Aulographum hederae CBS 113979]|uniref:Uncharacterized protein n=1 Tax=Aulographum hederae CBS 113979 TaxID=1176131 RepID=A0A6G1HE92_9PEZI|nr:hypothetical protein K402DRAFT_388755 [Aulographum hederae CBS 113979]
MFSEGAEEDLMHSHPSGHQMLKNMREDVHNQRELIAAAVERLGKPKMTDEEMREQAMKEYREAKRLAKLEDEEAKGNAEKSAA